MLFLCRERAGFQSKQETEVGISGFGISKANYSTQQSSSHTSSYHSG